MDKIKDIADRIKQKDKWFCKAWDVYDYVMGHFEVTDEEAKQVCRKLGYEIY